MTTVGATSSPYVSEAPRLGFVGGFDGVRGIGILMVLSNHAYSALSPSFAGIIDVFFVMSAFLITTLLLQEHRDQNTISMRKFYSRRAIRLLPSAYLCIAAWLVVTILFARDRLTTLLAESAAAVTYLYEIFFPVGLGQLDPKLVEHLSIDQFWSLAVEEQFYLLIAVTVLVCIRKRWMVQLAVGLAAVATFIGVQRYMGIAGPVPIPSDPAHANPVVRGLSLLWLSRPDSLMWGVGLAVLNSKLPEPLPAVWRRWLPRVGLVGLVVSGVSMLLASGFLFDLANKVGVPYPFVPIGPLSMEQAGDRIYWINFGHTVTALYELTLVGSQGSIDPLRYKKAAKAHDELDGELGFLRLRYKPLQANTSELIEVPLQRSAIKSFPAASNEFRFATAVAGYGQLLRGGKYTGNWSYADARQLAAGSLGKDSFGYRGEFLRMVDLTSFDLDAKTLQVAPFKPNPVPPALQFGKP